MTTIDTQIQIPSKYDIIPIHTSDRATFKACRRKWNWSSPARNNFTRRVDVFGIYPPFWFGTGIHYAIEKYYNPAYTEDIVVAFETWYNMQINGGTITPDELGEYADRNPKELPNGLYNVDGLSDLMPYYDADEFDEYRATGIGMLTYYKEYAQAHDNFTVVAVEQNFSVPITDADGNAIYMVDTRTMPEDWEPNFITENALGPLMYSKMPLMPSGIDDVVILKQVHARGRMDQVIQDNESARYGLRDYKTTSRVDDDYFRHLDLDEQCTTYSWAAEQMAILYDLPYKVIDFIDYQALLKNYPKPPTVNKRGFPLSLNKQAESTTAEMFAEAIDLLGIRKLFEADENAQRYYTYLVETQDRRFINTYRVRRNKFQKYNCGRRLFFEAMDMLDPNISIYPNPTKDYGCLNCWFRPPCVMVEDGGDYKILLEDGYVKNYDR